MKSTSITSTPKAPSPTKARSSNFGSNGRPIRNWSMATRFHRSGRDNGCASPSPFSMLAAMPARCRAALAGPGQALSAGMALVPPENLAGVPFEVELDHRDFVTALTRRPEPADAGWCGLSIHHLSPDGKRDLLKAIRGSTSAFLMIYEPTLNEDETREAYLARFRRVNRPAWSFLSDEEWAEIDHHVTSSDYPETSANWIALGREAGFADARELFCDLTGFYRIYRYDV